MVWLGAGAAILVVLSYALLASMTPVNSAHPVVGISTNHYLKVQYTKNGPIFVTVSTKGAKKSLEMVSIPQINAKVGELVRIHLINEDRQKHNLNLDEFNVHMRDLGFFEAQEIMFLADKPGKFIFYCSLHPEMTGTVIID